MPLRRDLLSQGRGLFLEQTPRHDDGVAGRRQDIPCVQREQGRDPAGEGIRRVRPTGQTHMHGGGTAEMKGPAPSTLDGSAA
jgi:hypothetical protein